MKINTPSRKKIIIISTIAVLAIIGASIFTLLSLRGGGKLFGWSPLSSDQSSVNYQPPSQEEIDNGKKVKDETVNSSSDQSPKTSPKNEAENSPTPTSQVGVTITAANQNGQTLQIRTLVETVSSSGTCNLQLSKGSQTITKTAGLQALASTSTCKGFDVPVNELSPGLWALKVTYTNNSVSGNASQQVTIQ